MSAERRYVSGYKWATSAAWIPDLFKESTAEFMANGLESELDNELGYSKYDYKTAGTGTVSSAAHQLGGY